MEVLDENSDLIAWFSDDPDDFNSFSDFELKIRRLVIELNEEIFSIGSHLFGYDEDNALEYIKLLGSINRTIYLSQLSRRNFARYGLCQIIDLQAVTQTSWTNQG